MEENKLNYEEFEPKFGSWAQAFRPFIEGPEMYKIYQKLKDDAFFENGRRKEHITPDSEVTFRSFLTTPKDKVKVVFYLMDPYPRKYKNGVKQATGIPMDCTNSPDGTLQPSLIKFYDAMDRELGIKVMRSPDLRYFNQQGLMLMNTDLTCKLNKTASHEGLWEPFQKYFLEEVMRGTQVIYVLCGKASHKMEKYISPLGNTIIKLEHPAYAERQKTDWNSKGIFKQLDNELRAEGKVVFWDRQEWDTEPPF